MDPTENLLRSYFSRGIIVDTNILLLLFVGELNPDRISKFSRTEQFTATDYELLITLLKQFNIIATTPNILTEVNSLLNKLGEPARKVFADRVADTRGTVVLEENYLPTREVASSDWSFLKYGLTDCGIAELAQRKTYLVLTDDLKAAHYFNKKGIDTVNFNNLRFLSLTM